jgi:cyclic di-GMP phosphodiesterase
MPGPRIIVLDDDDGVRAVWVDALQAAGYTVNGFGLGGEVLARLPDLAPDLILLDMMMPGMDGYEFLARLRANPASSRVPLLIVSGIGESLAVAIDDRAASALGVAAILTKPLDLNVLLQHVERIAGPPA